MEITKKIHLKTLKEGKNVEFKKTSDTFPKDALETYSAFANSDGGLIILGVEETNNDINVTGVSNTSKVIKEMFDNLQNSNKVSKNLLSDDDIIIQDIDGKNIIIMRVPSAKYTDKPIHLNNNKYKSYFRLDSGDYPCSKELVDEMIRDSVRESFDSKQIKNFTIDDLDKATIKKYRTYFSNIKPDHTFNSYDDLEFLIRIGAMVPDRLSSGALIPTIAGLLVFGKYSSITEKLPHYHIEFIDKIDVGVDYDRWRDRVVYDGTWGEGNLYNFFFLVINKLYSTLKSSFELDSNSITRKEDSPMRQAIREAFVNSIIHNDFQSSTGIIITRYEDRFEFLNGGSLRITKKQYFAKEFSEPRNHTVQRIFSFINLCERAGTGVPKILTAVRKYNLFFPDLETQPGRVLLTIYDTSIIENANDLNNQEKEVLSYIINNITVKRLDIDEYFNIDKPTSLLILNSLIQKNYIESFGKSSATRYKLKNNNPYGLEIDLIKTLDSLKNIIKKSI